MSKIKKILSVMLSISRIIHHIVVIYITPVQNYNISRWFFHFFKILIFWVVRGAKVQKNGPKWQKNRSVTLHVSGTIPAADLGFNFKRCAMSGKATNINGTLGLGGILSPRSQCIQSYLQPKTRLKWQRQLSSARFA